jgi:hypothetical protein
MVSAKESKNSVPISFHPKLNNEKKKKKTLIKSAEKEKGNR